METYVYTANDGVSVLGVSQYGAFYLTESEVSKGENRTLLMGSPNLRVSGFRLTMILVEVPVVMNWSKIVSDRSQDIGFPAVSRSGDISVSGCWKQCLSLGLFFLRATRSGGSTLNFL